MGLLGRVFCCFSSKAKSKPNNFHKSIRVEPIKIEALKKPEKTTIDQEKPGPKILLTTIEGEHKEIRKSLEDIFKFKRARAKAPDPLATSNSNLKVNAKMLRRRWSLPEDIRNPEKSVAPEGLMKPRLPKVKTSDSRSISSNTSTVSHQVSSSSKEDENSCMVMSPAGPISMVCEVHDFNQEPDLNSIFAANVIDLKQEAFVVSDEENGKGLTKNSSSSSSLGNPVDFFHSDPTVKTTMYVPRTRRNSIDTALKNVVQGDSSQGGGVSFTSIRNFEDDLKQYMKAVVFPPNEMIIRKNTIGKEMYFLSKGTVQVVSSDGKTVYNTIHEGAFFGELGVLFNVPRTASVRSVGWCKCHVLMRESLEKVLANYPLIAEKFRRAAEERMLKVNSARTCSRRLSETRTNSIRKPNMVTVKGTRIYSFIYL